MSIIFRCDAGFEYGLGHFSRCMVIAKSLSNLGIVSRFAINAPEVIYQRIVEEGYQLQALSEPINNNERSDHWIDNNKLVVLDTPKITHNYLSTIPSSSKIIYFDDDVTRDHNATMIINNHLWARHSDYQKIYPNRTLLLGPKFNTIAPQYFANQKNRHGMLITMGGEDPNNMTSLFIKYLASLKINMPIRIIIGPAHPNPQQVKLDAEKHLPNSELFFSPNSLIPFMNKSHLAITAGGTTCYELAASKIPFIVCALEKSQEKLTQTVAQHGLGIALDNTNGISVDAFHDAIYKLHRKDIFESIIEMASNKFPRPGVDLIAEKIAYLLQ